MGKNIVLFTTLILFLSVCFLRRECSNVECQKDGIYGIAIKLQFLISRQDLRIFYPKVRTISWQCLGKCLLEENEDIVNIYGCQKGKIIIYILLIFSSIYTRFQFR